MKGAPEEVIEAAIARIRELGYLDDPGYCLRRAEILAERGYGNRYIAYRLSEIGVPDDLAEQSLAALPQELTEEKRIRMVMKKEKGRKKDMVRFLASRGFAYESIYRIIGGEAP